jgi:lipoate-protein ligase B
MTTKPLNFYVLGLIDYKKCFDLQNKIHDLCCRNKLGPTVLLVEHPPVITLGKNSKPENIRTSNQILQEKNIAIHCCNRGGEVTAHMPGQLVMYPILPLHLFNLNVRKYIHLLENTAIKTLRYFGVSSKKNENYPGVWTQNKKICAIGVRIKNRVSMHGIALNINNNLELYDHIIPCGIKDHSITTLSTAASKAIGVNDVTLILIKNFTYFLDATIHHVIYNYNAENFFEKNLEK